MLIACSSGFKIGRVPATQLIAGEKVLQSEDEDAVSGPVNRYDLLYELGSHSRNACMILISFTNGSIWAAEGATNSDSDETLRVIRPAQISMQNMGGHMQILLTNPFGVKHGSERDADFFIDVRKNYMAFIVQAQHLEPSLVDAYRQHCSGIVIAGNEKLPRTN